MQADDGNLVIRGPNGEYVWDTGTNGHPGSWLVVRDYGVADIVAADGTHLWQDDWRQLSGTTPTGNQMHEGEVLYPGESLSSPNGLYSFIYNPDGNLELNRMDGGNVPQQRLWDSGTQGQHFGVCALTHNAGPVLINLTGRIYWMGGRWDDIENRLVVQDDGNVVIYAPDGTSLWSTNTRERMILYSAVWEHGDRGTSRAIGWGFSDFVSRFNAEIADGHHLVHMQAYDLGGGQIRWDGVWELGNRGTTRALGWAFSDFVPRFDAEIAAGRHLVHMQAYDLGGGQIRWDAVWESGDRGTTRVLGWAFSDFVPRFNAEIAAGHHLVHMQAYDLGGGEIRWDGVWEQGDRGMSSVLGWGLDDFGAQFVREAGAGRHLVHLQAYDLGGGQIRYDGVWEAGAKGNSFVMSWGFTDFVGRLEQESGGGRRLVHLQAYDVGDGQIRYDGVWENSGGSQTFILGESLKRFADRFDHEIGAERHVTLMQAVIGR